MQFQNNIIIYEYVYKNSTTISMNKKNGQLENS